MPAYKIMGHVFTFDLFLKKGEIFINLVTVKSRCAPIKANIITRLELLGNILLSRLMISVKNALSKILTIPDCFYWTSSGVTIS